MKEFQEATDLFARIPYFKGVEQRLLEAVIRSSARRAYEPGQLVILEGEPADGLYIVETGSLKASRVSVDGREQILQFLGSGEAFNAVSVFTGAVNQASVTALEASQVWLIRRETMLKLLETHPLLARVVIENLAGRVQHLIALVEDLSLRSVEARLARLLLEQAEGDVVPRQRWATQNEIAARLGTVADMVSRTLRRLAERGVIEITRQEIRILNQQALKDIAEVEP